VAWVEGSACKHAVGAFFFFFLRVAWVGGSVSRRAAGARCSGASSVVFYIYRTILVYNLCFIKIKVVINRIIVT